MKFKVGDIITGTKYSDDRYTWTTSHGKYIVEAIYDDTQIRVRVVEHKYQFCIGYSWKVDSSCFILVRGKGAMLK